MKKIVLIGASGFLGRNLAKNFRDDFEVIGVGRSPVPAAVERELGCEYRDLTLDDQQMKEVLNGADFVFHLATDTTPGSSRLQPSLEGMNNLLPSLKLLETLQAVSSGHLIYLSSGGAIYGSGSETPANGFSEEAAVSSPSYYGAAKLAFEAFIAAYCLQTGNAATLLRPSNIYGPGQIAKKGFGIVPTLFNCMRKNEQFTVWGDGTAIRDYLFIDDFASLCRKIVESSREIDKCQIINAGSSQGVSISKLCSTIEEITGRHLRVQYKPQRNVDISRVVLDNRRARSLFEWRPETQLETGLVQTWSWYCDQYG